MKKVFEMNFLTENAQKTAKHFSFLSGKKMSFFVGFTTLLFFFKIAAASENAVAVMPFAGPDTSAQSKEQGMHIAERLSSFIAQSHLITVVERIQIEKAYRETALGQSGIITESTAAEAGEMIGATHVIVGSFTFEGTVESIQARIVNIETGIVIGSVIKEGPKESAIIDAIAIKLLDHLGIHTSYNTSYNVKRTFMWVSGIAALGCGGSAVWSHLKYKTADENYQNTVKGSRADFTALADKAQLYFNARLYLASSSAALLCTGITLFIVNKSAWKFESKKTAQGYLIPIISPQAVGLSYTVHF